MSYNIKGCHVISSNGFSIKIYDALKLSRIIEKEYGAEINFIEDVISKLKDDDSNVLDYVDIPDPSWIGEGSGGSFQSILMSKVFPKTVGNAEVVYYWEGGYMIGVRINDSAVTSHKVVMSLGEQVR